MRLPLLAVMALVACRPPVSQQSECGPLLLFSQSPTFDVAACVAVVAVQRAVGHEAAQRAANRFAVVIDPEVLHAFGDVGGLTFCESSRLIVENDDWYRSGLAHELMHGTECEETDNKHETWGDPADPNSKFGAVEWFHHVGDLVK